MRDVPVARAGAGRSGLSPGDRVVRQVQAVEAWLAARRVQEQALRLPGMTRDERLFADRQLDALRQTHDAIKICCARGLAAHAGSFSWAAPTAVVAHRHAWLAQQLALHLGERGVLLVASTDNGAEALGAVVAEQPDLLLAGDRLAMMTGVDLLSAVRAYAPDTLVGVSVGENWRAEVYRPIADAVFRGDARPADIADTLVTLCARPTG